MIVIFDAPVFVDEDAQHPENLGHGRLGLRGRFEFTTRLLLQKGTAVLALFQFFRGRGRLGRRGAASGCSGDHRMGATPYRWRRRGDEGAPMGGREILSVDGTKPAKVMTCWWVSLKLYMSLLCCQ